MSDERASRLRSRRGKARERVEAQQRDAEGRPVDSGEKSTAESESTESTAAEGNDGTDVADDAGSVKDERVGTYMYLPEAQKRELQRVYGTLKVAYEYEFDEEFEKNRHFFPAVVRHGLETLDGMDATEVRDVVDDLE
ncbi:hypothetical protein [Halomarina oriensis]|uniref:DUF8160 domain-containing protein n=1 Tax=Halomarina oriensis TaxID=671145 RepID=A0A6B0GEB1_9EURY|nr:hypothetical protein [Halomarina oriensis]MWG33152.1 hypothetical protein [Halomarina oriensis]